MNFRSILVCLSLSVLNGCAVSDNVRSVERGDFGVFERSLNTSLYGYQVVADPEGEFLEHPVERFEVRSGDCSSNNGWSDCDNDRERSEIRELLTRENEGTSVWYGWNLYVPPDWPTVFPTKTVLGQFHQNRSHPVWMFLHLEGGLYLDDQSLGFSSRRVPLIKKNKFSGQWHRIEVHAKWSRDESGFFRVFIEGENVFDHQGTTMTADSVYFRYGVYRSYLSRFKTATGRDAVPTQIAYYTNVRKSQTQLGLR